ncbi:hypothetical protein [Mesorhizobium sp. M0859]|uniref:hypothetical protein n=1 Tax=Mesorhizobium sp. M0859 TaxID=2957014 RepID=UPI0033382EC4
MTDPEAPAAREVAWLIERKDASLFQQPHWYHEEPNGWHWWTPAAHEAKRFVSKAEAEAFPAYQMIASDPTIRITEHVFIGSLPEAPASLSKRYCQCANSKTNPCIVCGKPKFIDPEWLKRKIEEDRDEGEIGAGFELFPLPEAPAAPVAWRVRERPGFEWGLVRTDPDRDPHFHCWEKQPLFATPALVAAPPAPTDSTRPDYDLRCEECGRAHILDTVIPSGIWNQIAEPHNVLCTVCIDKRLQAKGLTAEAEFYFVGDALVSKLYATPPPQTSAVDGDTIAAIMEDIWTMARCSSPTDRQFWADKFCAALNAQAAPTSAVDGEMVKVLTPKMAEAGRAKLVELGYDGVDFTDAQQVYLAMRDAAPISAVDGLTYARISEIVHECRDRQRSAGEGDQMLSRWISEALSKAQAAPVGQLYRELLLLMESYTAYAGDAVPASILTRSQDLHARLSALVATPPASEAYPPKSLLQTAERIIDAQRAEKKRRGIDQ